MEHLVGYTHNDIPVFVDLIKSDAARHVAQQPYLLTLATEALQQATLAGAEVNLAHNMGRTIGYDYVIETTDTDAVFYAQLVREDIYTRFVKSGDPLPARHLTMALNYRQADNCYDLTDVWVGRVRPPRPGSIQETTKGNVYWGKHAFIFENQPLQSRTLTKTCPY